MVLLLIPIEVLFENMFLIYFWLIYIYFYLAV